MTPDDEKPPAREEVGEKQPPVQDLRRVIEEYANDLRQFIRRLRKRLH